jgi:uncharacterized protein
MSSRVTFTADGFPLVGDLRVAGPGAPAVVLTGPFTGVKEQVTGTYARLLGDRGVTTLAFDHRGFGESGGRRAHEDSQGKLSDLRAAVSLLAADPSVDAARIGAVGVCLGGGYAVRAAAADPRIRAVAVYDAAPGPKELLWLDASLHVDLYDTEPYVTQAADAAAAFLHKHLRLHSN